MAFTRRSLIGVAAAMAALGAWRYWPRPLMALAETSPPMPAADGPLNTYHLGHSLVGRDMPAMLAQLAGHTYDSQLGWGTPLKAHWDDATPINGFETENAHPRFRPAKEALKSGEYDVIVLTEMVDIRDAVRFHDSADYLARWVEFARAARPDVRIYLYETWPHCENDAEWLARIREDHDLHWQDNILRPAAARSGPIHMIPAGQVLAAYLADGADADDILARTPERAVDTIHLGDKGNYLVALAHHATLYQRDPEGLPRQLLRADGTKASAPSAAEAAAMQRAVWHVVKNHPATGIAP